MKRGDIVLVPFYFTDYKGFKLRPALIVSAHQSQEEDLIVAFISTIIPGSILHPTHFIIHSTDSYFPQTGLHKTSVIKCDKLMTISKLIIQGWMGELPPEIITIIDSKLRTALSL